MRVVYDHQIFVSQRYGGISRYFAELAPRVAAAGADVTVIMGLFLNQYGLETHSSVKHPLSLRRPEVRSADRLFNAVSTAGFLSVAVGRRAEIYHPTYYKLLPGPRGSRRVVTVHDMIHEMFADVIGGRAARKTINDKRRSVRAADLIVAVSESTKRDLVGILGVSPEQVTVAYLASSLQCTPSSAEMKGRPYFLYVGARSSYKNFTLLLDVLADEPEVTKSHDLVCFGGGPFTDEETATICARGLSPVVKQTSGSDQILADLYAGAEALVYPSLYEGFGIPPLEAMQYGCPVIASDSSSIPEVVGDAGILFDPTNGNALGSALKKVLADYTLRADLIRRGRNRHLIFSWEKCTRRTMDVYRAALS